VSPPGNQADTENTYLILQPGPGLRGERFPLTGRQQSAEGIVGPRARAEGPNGGQAGAPDGGPRPRPGRAARAALRGAEG
jgi:hypothetical protein